MNYECVVNNILNNHNYFNVNVLFKNNLQFGKGPAALQASISPCSGEWKSVELPII